MNPKNVLVGKKDGFPQSKRKLEHCHGLAARRAAKLTRKK